MIFFREGTRTVLLFAFCHVVGATKPQTYPAGRPKDFLPKFRILFRLYTQKKSRTYGEKNVIEDAP